MKVIKTLLKRPLLLPLLIFLLLEFLPVSGKKTAQLRLYENPDFRNEYTTYYALQPDGDLVSWGRGPLDHADTGRYRSTYPYVLRQVIARNVTDFACTSKAILYVDQNHVLWGSGSDDGILRFRGHKRVWLMGDVEQIAADDNCALALKTDGSLWTWPGNNRIKGNRTRGIELPDQPEKIAENICAVFLVNGDSFAITKEDTLLFWDLQENGEWKTVAQNVESVSSMYLRGGTIYQYLDRQGEVHLIYRTSTVKAVAPPIADHVVSLCDGGFIREDHSLWIWQGASANGAPKKLYNGVWTAANSQFYVDIFGRLHWRTSSFKWKALPQPVRWLDPASRKIEALLLGGLLLVCLLYIWDENPAEKLR